MHYIIKYKYTRVLVIFTMQWKAVFFCGVQYFLRLYGKFIQKTTRSEPVWIRSMFR